MVRGSPSIWNRGNTAGLAVNIAISIGLALAANALVFLVNPAEQARTPAYRLQPPGFVIGIVWIILFASMGTARWLIVRREEREFKNANLVFLLILLCVAYPLYTLGLSSLTVGLAGNIVTAVTALWVAIRIRNSSMPAALLAGAPAVWVVFATYLILEQILGRSL